MTEAQKRIAAYVKKIDLFIDSIRDLFDRTENEVEKTNRNGVFDTLLNLATYSSVTELEVEFRKTLPHEKNETLDYIRDQIREINGVCTFSFSDGHTIYQNLHRDIADHETKKALSNTLSSQVKELIFAKTNNDSLEPIAGGSLAH